MASWGISMRNGMASSVRLWLGLALLMALPGCGPLVLSVDDAVVMKGRPVALSAYVGRQHMLGLRSEIERVPVTFSIDGQPVGRNTSDGEGQAAVTVHDFQGSARSFHVQAHTYGRTLEATGRIFHWEEGQVIIAVDIDHTISQTNYRNLVLKEQVQVSPPIPGARETLADIARDYHILYLTARPRFLIEKTRDWLARYDFPPGPVAAAPRVRDAMHQLQFKQKTLYRLREQWPDLLIGIGNRTDDIEAYASSRMLPVIVFNDGEEKHFSDAVVLQDWQAVHEFFQANRQMLTSPPKLMSAIGGQLMFLQPLIPFEATKSHYKPKPFEPGD